jgi:LPXTG-site transpeptidase (sortase) family protein
MTTGLAPRVTYVTPPVRNVALAPFFVSSSALTIVAALALTFVATITLLGPVRHARDQQTGFATLRGELANATAMVTQLDENGAPYPLGTGLAVIDIPQIGVREVVFEGTTSGVLRSGPGHRRDSPMPGQAGTSVIFGRQAGFGGPFSHLDQLRKGAVFTVTTGQGKHLYRVLGPRRAGDPQAPAVAAGQGRITLITTAGRPFVPEGVLRVDADLVTAVQPAGPRPITTAALPAAETALSGDSSVWVAILLLSQALLLVALAVTWARSRWGRTQVWLTGMPVLLALGVALSNHVACLLPNLM